MNKNAIEVRNMSKQFKIKHDTAQGIKDKLLFWNRGSVEYHQVLKNINLDIKQGETVALIGTNGSGKSTLLKLMSKIYYPTEGNLKVNGKLTSLLELGAGFHIEFTGRENIYFNASIFGLTRQDIDKRLDDIIEFSELGSFIDSPVRTYSSGMFMRLAFSVAINVDADILLVDEILAVGDQHYQEKCYAKLKELQESGKTIVIVTHALDVVEEMCHRAIWIYDGEVKMDGEPKEVIHNYLERVALDRQQRQKKKDTSKKHFADIFIDKPEHYEVCIQDSDLLLNGWCCCSDEYEQLIIEVDGKEIDGIERVPRHDVFDVYNGKYNMQLNANTLGWQKEISLREFEKGKHMIVASCKDCNGNLLNQVEQVFTVY